MLACWVISGIVLTRSAAGLVPHECLIVVWGTALEIGEALDLLTVDSSLGGQRCCLRATLDMELCVDQ